jgi:hypothetical protein
VAESEEQYTMSMEDLTSHLIQRAEYVAQREQLDNIYDNINNSPIIHNMQAKQTQQEFNIYLKLHSNSKYDSVSQANLSNCFTQILYLSFS